MSKNARASAHDQSQAKLACANKNLDCNTRFRILKMMRIAQIAQCNQIYIFTHFHHEKPSNRAPSKEVSPKNNKRRSTFSSTPNERVASKMMLEHILLFTNMSLIFAALAHRVALLGNLQSSRNFVQRFRVSFGIVNHLILIDSSISDVHVDEDTYKIFSKPLINLRIDDFVNDDLFVDMIQK